MASRVHAQAEQVSRKWYSVRAPCSTSYGTSFSSSATSPCLRPMKRLIEKTVFSGFVIA